MTNALDTLHPRMEPHDDCRQCASLARVEAVIEAAREIGRPGRSVDMEFPYLAERMDVLAAALAALDEGGEP